MRIPPRIVLGSVALLGFCLTGSKADAAYRFQGINTENLANAEDGQRQLAMTVQTLGTTQVVFRFTNSGPDAMSVAGVYFDDGGFLDIPTASAGGSGVSFSGPVFGPFPPNNDPFPGGGTLNPEFETSVYFAASDMNGVNPGDALEITFDRLASYEAIIDGLEDGTLRIGLLVRGFADSDNAQESFVNEGVEAVPAPAAIVLVASAFPVLGLRRLLRRKTA
jgi:hypothetical protein